MYYLETRSTNPYYNLAFEEYVLSNRLDGDYLILWQNSASVIIGQNQNVIEEVNVEYAAAENIPVIRRMSGGGAVFHDPGNLNYSLITDFDPMRSDIHHLADPMVQCLRKLGINAVGSERNDISVGGRKISGSAQRIVKKRILHHGTLLFDTDLEKLEKILKCGAHAIDSNQTASVRSSVANIRDMIPEDMDIENLKQYIAGNFTDGTVPEELSPAELKEIIKISESKYSSDDWNYRRFPGYSYHNEIECGEDNFSVCIDVKAGEIFRVEFGGSCLKASQGGLSAYCLGILHERRTVERYISEHPFPPAFVNMSKQQLITLICS